MYSKSSTLLKVSDAKRLHLIRIIQACRLTYQKSLEFLEAHPRGACEETFDELNIQLIAWYKSQQLPPYLLFTTAKYVTAKVRRDYKAFRKGGALHPRERFEKGYETKWKHFRVPISNLLIDPYRREMMVMGIGHFQYNKSLPSLEKINSIHFHVTDSSQYIVAEYYDNTKGKKK